MILLGESDHRNLDVQGFKPYHLSERIIMEYRIWSIIQNNNGVAKLTRIWAWQCGI